MFPRLLTGAGCVLLAATGLLVAGCGGAEPRAGLTIIAMGDSLAVGVQPRIVGSDVETRQGYPRQLARRLRDRGRRVRLVELGCGGATSSSVLTGGRPCAPKRKTPYRNEDPASSQLAAAEGELSRLRGQPAAVVLDIGGNDVGSCLVGGRLRAGCIRRAGQGLQTNLETLFSRLRAVAPQAPIVVLDLYNPFLGLWRAQPDARAAILAAHREFLREVNGVITTVAARHDVIVARLSTAMRQEELPAPLVENPPAVAAVCANTWMCVPPPQVPDIHLRRSGYALAAAVIERSLVPALATEATR